MKKKATKKVIAQKEIIAPKKIVDRRDIPDILTIKYLKDYEVSIAEFPENKKAEFLEHLLECLSIIKNYAENPTTANYKLYADKENAFLKKHGKRLKMYRQTRMHLYYGDHHVLVEKGVYTNDEWNALSTEKQRLSKDEFIRFIDFCQSRISLYREYMWASQAPEDEREENLAGKNPIIEKTGKKRKINRNPNDKMTCLSQEQTSLLVYFLQQGRVFLNENYLDDKEIGSAIQILTGYSENTLRTSIGGISKIHSIVNLKEIDKLLEGIKKTVEQAIKELSPKKSSPLQEGS
ncbi:MAG: hypothetical protein ACYDCN_05110 [Bacteroidia bacterium]